MSEAAVHDLAERARSAAAVNPAESLSLAEQALSLAVALGQPRPQALAQRACAVALWAQGRWQDAWIAFETGVRLAEEAGDPLLAAQIPIAGVETLAHLGRHDEALELAASLEARLRDLGAEADAAKVVANTGNVHFEREDFAAAIDCYRRALTYFEAQQQVVPTARLQMNIANVLTQLNRLPEALEMYEQARVSLEASGQERLAAGLEGNLGYLRFMAGQFSTALQAYHRARDRFAALSLPKDLAKCDREIADVYLQLNLIPEALDAYDRAQPVFDTLGMAAEGARNELGRAAALAATHEAPLAGEAAAAIDRAENAFRRERNSIGIARSRLLRSELPVAADGRADPGPGGEAGGPNGAGGAEARRAAAARDARAALRTFRRHGLKMGEAQARLRLAELRVDSGEAPVRSLSSLRRDAERGSLVSLAWRIEAALARSWMNVDRPARALKHYRRAVEEVERLRVLLRGDEFRIAFLHDKLRLYEELMALLLDRGTTAAQREGFSIAERSKSRALLDLLMESVASAGAGPNPPAQQRLLLQMEALRAQLNWDYGRAQQLDDGPAARATDAVARLHASDPDRADRLRGLERDYLDMRRQLSLETDDRSDRARLAAPPIPNPAELRALLQPDEQIVEFVTVRDEVLAFVVDPRRFRVVRGLASRREVEEQAERLRFHWRRFAAGPAAEGASEGAALNGSDPCLQAARQTLGTLYEMLLEPLEPFLTRSCLTVIPHGVLHGLPFHAFWDGERYALDRWEFTTAPSAAVWSACRQRGEVASDRSLLFGTEDPWLPHVREEIEDLKRLLPGAEALVGSRATVAAVPERGDFAYLHFATHAVFRPDNPVFSGMRLADGWLVATDLARRRLDCRLATLAACRTGMSRVAPGDELLGLARGFLHAGARAVLVSLWTADDAATAALMQGVYRRLAAGEGRAAAIRAAQREVREQYPHPYYWAAFTLVGAR